MPAAILQPEEQQQPIREFIAKAKDVSPVVKLGIEKLSALPGASQVQKLSDPLVNAVDHSLVRAYAALPFSLPTLKHVANDQLTTIKQHIPTQWLTRVDDILAKARTIDVQQVPATITTTTAEVKQSIQAFYATSVDHFLVLAKAKLNVQLHVTSNNGHANGNGNGNGDDSHVVTREEFVAGLKAKLKHVWDDSLVAPAELFYERAKTLYVDHIGTKVNALTQSPPASPSSTVPGGVSATASSYLSFLTSLRTKLGAEWEQKVVEGLYPTLQLRVSQPAKEVYASALAHYLKLQEQPRVVKATEFVQSYKQAIGQNWNDRLEQPLREIYGTWKQQRRADLEKLHTALDYDQNGYLTVSDFVDTSLYVVSAAHSTINNKWQAVLHNTINTFDSFIPATEQQEQELKSKAEADETIEQTPVTVTGVATHVTQRLRDRTNSAYTTIRQRAATNVDYVKSTAQSRIVVARQFGADRFDLVRKFSSQKLAPIIHIDLVNVAEDLLTKQVTAYQSVQSRIGTANAQVQSQLETASARVKASLEQLQHTLADVTAKAKSHLPVDAVQHHLSTANNQLQSYRNIVTTRVTSTVTSTVDSVQQQPSILELQRKLRDSILHARALVSTSNDYVLHTRITQIPTDIFTLLQQSRTLVVAKSQETSREALTSVTNHLNDVIASVKELLHWKRVQAAEGDGEIPALMEANHAPCKTPCARFVVAAPTGEVVAPLVAAIEEKEAAAAAAAAITSPVKSPMKGAHPPTAHLNMSAPVPIETSAPSVAKKSPAKSKNGKKKAPAKKDNRHDDDE